MEKHYYNEHDLYAAQWLRNLIAEGLIPDGDVDERDIQQVKPDDLEGYTQCHFFAGIGGWSLALQLAGVSPNTPLWTGSCPCQPFSTAGKRKGKDDDRHLWPTWFNLIKKFKPELIFGEQVASAITHGWWDDVSNDLATENYTSGIAVLPACSVGSPQKRDRLFFVGYSEQYGRHETPKFGSISEGKNERRLQQSEGSNPSSFMGNPKYYGQSATTQQRSDGEAIQHNAQRTDSTSEFTGASNSKYVASANLTRSQRYGEYVGEYDTQGRKIQDGYPWSDNIQYVQCPDGRTRVIEPSIQLLAHGVPSRMGKLRALGNAIVPQVAAEFIKESMAA